MSETTAQRNRLPLQEESDFNWIIPSSPEDAIYSVASFEPTPTSLMLIETGNGPVLEGMSALRDEINKLRQLALKNNEMLSALLDAPQSVVIPISSLAPLPYELLRPISALVEPVLPEDPEEDCEYIASFVEASVGATGDTIEEAMCFLKECMVEKMSLLEELPKLGEDLQRQLSVLQDVIRKCPEEAATK